MKAVTSGDEIALDPVRLAVVRESDFGVAAVEIVQGDVVHFEQQWTAGRIMCRQQILDDLVLAVDRDPAAAGQRGHVNPMPAPRKRDVNAVVPHAFAHQPLADARVAEQVHRPLLEDAGADPIDHVFPGPVLDDDGIDSRTPEQVSEHQPGGPGSHDPDLRPHYRHW